MTIRGFIGDKPFYRRVLVIVLPILVQNIITNFVSLLDNVMVGRVGTEEMSGVAIVNQLIFVFNLFIFGAISGAGIFTAQFHGRNNVDGVRRTFRIKLILVAVITVLAELLFIFYGDELILLFLHEGEENIDLAATFDFARRYLRVILFSLPAFAVMQAYSDTLRSTDKTVLPMAASIVAIFVNTVLNYAFIFGKLGAPRLSVVGAALATVIARYAESLLVILITHLTPRKNPFIVGAYRGFAIGASLMRAVMRRGFPLMLNELLWALGTTMVVQAYSLRGLEAVSAQNISSTVSNLFFCAYFAFGNAISIMIGQLLGAGKLEQARDDDRKLIFTCVITCMAVGGIMAILAPLIPQIYNTLDSVKALASQFLLVSAALMPISGFTNASYFTLRSGGKTFVTFLFDSVFVWVVSIPVAHILSRFTAMPILTLYICVQSLEIIKAVIGFILLRSGIWVNNLVESENDTFV